LTRNSLNIKDNEAQAKTFVSFVQRERLNKEKLKLFKL